MRNGSTQRFFAWLPALAVALSAGPATPAVAADPPPAADLLLEAEDFRIESGWRAVGQEQGYIAATLSNTFVSRQRLLQAPEQVARALARKDVVVPADGRYRIWTRYALPSHFSAEHTVRIEQRGKLVFERRYGARDNPKLWPFRQGLKPMAEMPWGSGDNIVWEPSPEPVPLQKGPARVFLLAGPQAEDGGRGGAARREVDAVYLTTDAELGLAHPDERVWHALDRVLAQKGECWIRVTNPKEAPLAIAVQPAVYAHNPYWQARGPLPPFLGRAGGRKPEKDEDWIAPGQSTPWVAIGQALDTTNMQELALTAVYHVAPGQKAPSGSHFVVELARDPAGRRLLRRLEWRHPETPTLFLEIPHDLRGSHPAIRTLTEAQSELLAYLRALPPRGPFPVETPVYSVVGGPWFRWPAKAFDDLYRQRVETGLLLGRNTWEKSAVPPDLADRYHVEPRRNLVVSARGVEAKDVPSFVEGLRKKGLLEQAATFDLGDEISLPPYDPASAADREEFARYLAAEKAPLDAASDRLTKDPKDGRAFFWSMRFALDRGIARLKAITDALEKAAGPGIRTGANFTPHPDYWPQAGQWFRLFRKHAMTMPWSEDWVFQVPEFGMLASGYLCDVLRGAGAADEMPIHYYTMPVSPGQTPRDFTLSFYSALAHGNKAIDLFGAVPIYEYTENWVAWDAKPTWKAIRDVVADVGAADDIVARGRVRRAEVAMVVSLANDVWEVARGSSIYNFERKNLYYALRLAQVPIDFVSEEDIADGRLDGYKVIVLTGDHLLRRAAEGLRRWVAAGGTLVSVAGGGLRDEYDQPQGTVLHAVYGLTNASLQIATRRCFAKEGLAWLKPLAEVPGGGSGAETVPALAALQYVAPAAGADVTARFADGNAAVLENRFEKGRAVLFAFFPGTAWLQKAIPKRPFDRGATDAAFSHFLPVDFNRAAARLLLAPFAAAGVTRPVIAAPPKAGGGDDAAAPDPAIPIEDAPPPLDVTVIDAPEGAAVPIANYGGEPIARLTVAVRLPAGLSHARAARAGELPVQRRGGFAVVTLPLDWADVVTFRK